MKYIQPEDRNQLSMFNSLDEAISPNNPVRIIDILVEKIFLSNKEKFAEKREDIGRPKYHELTFLKLYLYGYLNGISSSRKLEAETNRNIEVIWLLGNLRPDHWVISNYRKDNGVQIKYLTKEFRKFLYKTNYIEGTTVAIDGTKVKAYTNRDMLTKKKIEKRLVKLDEKIEEYLEQLNINDTIDSFEEEMELKKTEGINQEILKKYLEAKNKIAKLEEAQRFLEENNRNYVSMNDKEARMMKSRDGFIPGYNLQSVTDKKHKMIADTEVVTDEGDSHQLEPMIDSVSEELGDSPFEALADKGYYNSAAIETIEKEKSVECFVSIRSKKKEEITFSYDKEKDEYLCSEGKKLKLKQRNKKMHNDQISDVYQGIECKGCKKREKCTKAKDGRILHRYHNHEWAENYERKMEEDYSREIISQRGSIVEHPFGTIKYWMGKIPLLLKGKEKVSTEINLYATAYNLRRLLNIEPFDVIIEKIIKYDWKCA